MDKNYFDHFGIEVSFLPDEKEIRKQYLRISKENHPDFNAGDDQAYEQALIVTSMNNQAYKTLNELDLRIKYVLDLMGTPLNQEDKLDPMFLMEMMEWNEEIMEIGMSDDVEKVQAFSERFSKIEKEFENRLMDAIKSYESGKDASVLAGVKEIYLQRKYLLRLRESIDKFARL